MTIPIKVEGKDGIIEMYQVLKSNKKIKQGPYEKHYRYATPMVSGQLLKERGQYANNMRVGIWSFYWGEQNLIAKGNYENDLKNGNWEYYKNGALLEKGDYKDDRREGPWTYFEKDKGIVEKGSYRDGVKAGKWIYYYKGNLVQTYDHTLDSLIQFAISLQKYEVVMSNDSVVKLELSRPPQYIGYKRQLNADLSKLTEYPAEARRIGLDGHVQVSFIINEDGSTSDYTILRDIGSNCGQAVVNALKSNPTRWISGMLDDKKVKVRYYQDVRFLLTFDPISGLGQSEIIYE